MPLALEPQRHHTSASARAASIRRHVEPPARGRPRARPRLEAAQQRRRAAEPHVGAGRGQPPDVGPRDAPVEDVAQDRDLAARAATARQWARIVYRSSSAWVGWACQPSPPLTTRPPKVRGEVGRAASAWRMTIMSAPSASSVRTVSTSDSPLA